MTDHSLSALLDRGVVIFDLEYTAWEGSLERDWSRENEHREIVQIGAVRLEADTVAEVDALECLVRPSANPVLSDYFVSLTGITNADVEQNGVDLATGLRRLADLAGPHTMLAANGDDGEVVQESCSVAQIASPIGRERFVCIHGALMTALGTSVDLVSSELPQAIGEAMPGRAHTALADARCIALTLRSLRSRGDL